MSKLMIAAAAPQGERNISKTRRDSFDATTSEPPALPRLAFTLKEAAQMLGVSYMTAFRLCQRGKLRSSNALRTKLISKTELERFLRTTTEAA